MKKLHDYIRPVRHRLMITSGLAFFLLVIYSAGAIVADVLHQAVHDHGVEELHSVASEKDPCHLAIYHGVRDGSCHHKVHLTRVPKCKYTHVIFLPSQLVGRLAVVMSIIENDCSPVSAAFSFTQSSTITQTLRGPPYLL